MENTPRGLRRHIALLGQTNAGKSTIFNLLAGQDTAIVSDKPGTTTDPVLKNIELLPFGPVTLIDTAGFGDDTELGKQRTDKTREVIRRADICVMITDAEQYNGNIADNLFDGEKIYVFSKSDLADKTVLDDIKKQYPDAVFMSKDKPDTVDNLKNMITAKLQYIEKGEEDTLIGGLVSVGGTIIMVVPIDSAAPKGRLILPQVQFLRDCLDHNIKVYVTRETELESALADLKKVDLVVTDSQIFSFVNKTVPYDIPLTSFSILLARQKGNIGQLLDGVKHIEKLHDGAKILMLEACTHSHTHEDIGRVKIPALINKHTGKKIEYDFYSGYSMPQNLKDYDMAILCGGCMINKREVTSRLNLLRGNNIPASNYGIVLAYLNGTLDRTIVF